MTRQASAGKGPDLKNNVTKSRNDLRSREEEYKRMNEELEAKTADLVREAEEVMKGQEETFVHRSMLDNINAEDFLRDFDDDAPLHDYDYDPEEYNDILDAENTPERDFSPSPASRNIKNDVQPKAKISSARSQASSRDQRATSRGAVPKDKGRRGSQSGPDARKAGKAKPLAKGRGVKSGSRAAEDVAVLDDDTFLTHKDYSLQQTISNIEGRLEDGLHIDDDEDDVLPSAAAEMGAEAQIRFLKAKLRVMQEELERLGEECSKKDEENSKLAAKVKDLEEERHRLARTGATHQTQMEKFRKMADDARAKSEGLEAQLLGLKKEYDGVNRTQKQQATSANAMEVRLNRALEDVEKYKGQLHKAKDQSKDTAVSDKKKIEQLLAENKRLEKQKNELMAGFKKQIKLIDILKRQKMHIEAAKMLSFTEEEFVKALEWNN